MSNKLFFFNPGKRVIDVRCALNQTASSDYQLVIRWNLAESKGQDSSGTQVRGEALLPTTLDLFYVTVSLEGSGPPKQYLLADGTTTTDRNQAKLLVYPNARFMLTPEREQLVLRRDPVGTVEYGKEAYLKATKGVDCSQPSPAPNAPWPWDQPFGVCHMLDKSPRAFWAAKYKRQFLNLLNSLNKNASGELKVVLNKLRRKSNWEIDFATGLATKLAYHPGSFFDYKLTLAAYVEEFLKWINEPFSLESQDVSKIANPLFLDSDPELQLTYGTLATHLLTHYPDLQADIAEGERAKDLRERVRLQSLQGGRLIHFGKDAVEAGADEVHGPIAGGGSEYAADAIGNGLIIAGLKASVVRAWEKQGYRIKVQVLNTQRSLRSKSTPVSQDHLDSFGADGLSYVFSPLESGSAQGAYTLPVARMAAAVKQGSTHPVPQPLAAWVSHDLVDSAASLKANEKQQVGNSLSFQTGEGRVSIHIKTFPKPKVGEEKTVLGYNVYGMWESNATEQYFKPGASEPSLAELQPWLMTRRYSYSLQLKKVLHDNAWEKYYLENPPHEALLEAPDSSSDETPAEYGNDEGKTEVPQPHRAGVTTWSFDLRQGMGDTLVHWDPKADPDTTWHPARGRVAGTKPLVRPQRYRFWVTAVDYYEQESEPLPVETSDPAVGQTEDYLYAPRYRTPLLPPPGKGDSVRELSLDDKKGIITVKWETPFFADIASKEQARRVPADQLGAYCLLLRRPFTSVENKPEASIEVQRLSQLPPAWQGKIKQLQVEENWQFVLGEEGRSQTTINPQLVQWKQDFDLKAIHQGYDASAYKGWEYIALVGFYVAADKTDFWFPNVLKNRELLTFGDSGKLTVKKITETPRISDLVTTEIKRYGSDAPARGASEVPAIPGGQSRFIRAEAVWPVEEIDRDLVLGKLLGYPVIENGALAEDEILLNGNQGGEVKLNGARKMVIETAVRRVTKLNLSKDEFWTRPELKAVRHILTSEFVGRSTKSVGTLNDESNLPQQHATIGFRGVVELAWTYRSLNSEPPVGKAEAEAYFYRFYHVSVPTGETEAAARALLSVEAATLVEDEEGELVCRFPKPKQAGEDVFLTLKRLPSIVAVSDTDSAKGDREYYSLGGFGSKFTDATWQISLKTTQEIPGDEFGKANVPVKLGFYPGQAIYEEQADLSKPEKSYRQYFPVGGGEEEFHCWWIRSVSGQEIEARLEDCIAYGRLFEATVQPPVPQGVTAVSPYYTEDEDPSASPDYFHLAEPGEEYLPQEVKDFGAIGPVIFPRVVLAWYPTESDDVVIEIRRKRRLLKDVNKPALSVQSTLSVWEALYDIQQRTEANGIPLASLAIIKDWLLGGEVVGPAPEGDLEIFPASLDLSGQEGMKSVKFPPSGESWPAFLDYYNRFGQGEAMNGDYAYAYSLVAARPLRNLGGKEVKYLKSNPTPWTAFTTPGSTAITVGFSVTDAYPLSKVGERSATPQVEFSFHFPQSSRSKNLEEMEIRYRVLVKRKIAGGMASQPTAQIETSWKEIGVPVDYQLKRNSSGGELSLIDYELERLKWDEALLLNYEIEVTQYQIAGNQEVLWRDQEQVTEVFCQIPAPVVQQDTVLEMRLPVKVKIDI